MASVALDLSPVVSELLDHPFDQPSLDRAYTAVGRHPQAYATALRCAAKKTRDSLAAAYWFAEAARVHETMDDLGGAIALLWRAHECDRGNPRPRELLAAAMVRLAMRARLGFTFTPDATPVLSTSAPVRSPEPGTVDTGLRPPPFERLFRDTVPEVLGGDGEDGTEAELETESGNTLPSEILRPPTLSNEEDLAPHRRDAFPAPEDLADLTDLTEFDDVEDRVEQLLPPPKDSTRESGIVHLSRSEAGEPVLRAFVESTAPARTTSTAPALVPPRPSAPPEGARKLAPMPSIIIAEPALAAPASAAEDENAVAPTSEPAAVTAAAPPPPSASSDATAKAGTTAIEPPTPASPAEPQGAFATKPPAVSSMRVPPTPSDVYAAEDDPPPTLRPAGDRLVGSIFEALHGLHFIADVREGASFVCRTLSGKLRAASTMVHLYDINSGHFIIVSAEGQRAAALSDYATKEDDALIATVLKGDDALLVEDPSNDPRLCRGRWALVEPKRSVLCAPVTREGRQLGIIELTDPAGGGVFNEDDKNAVMYAASALSSFLARRGLVLSDDPSRASNPVAV